MAGFGIYTWISCCIYYLIYQPVKYMVGKCGEPYFFCLVWCLVVGFFCCVPIVICSVCCSLWMPIMFLIENYENYPNYLNWDIYDMCDMLLLLSSILSFIYVVCICWIMSYWYKIFLTMYVNIHWYCFYQYIWNDIKKGAIPQILISNVINTYKNTPKRNEIIKDSFLGPDLANIVIQYLPKYSILMKDEKQIRCINNNLGW